MSKIKFGIVGCGRIGKRHAEHISNVGDLVSVCDIKSFESKSLADKYGAKSYESLDEMIYENPETDVISICTPNGLHASQSIRSLESGFHVLCEKPMTIRTDDCKQMINAANKAGKKIFVVKQNRFNPPVKAVKEVLDKGILGKIFSVQLNCFWNRRPAYYTESDWKGSRALDGGTLFTQFSHFIDLLYWMIGDVEKSNGWISNYSHQGIIEFEDSGVINLVFKNGVIGSIHYTVYSFDKNMEGSITIFAENGTIKIGGQYLNELEYQEIKNLKITDLPRGNPPNNYGEYKGSMSNHGEVYKNVIEVLNHQGTIATGGQEGLKTVEIIENIYENVKMI